MVSSWHGEVAHGEVEQCGLVGWCGAVVQHDEAQVTASNGEPVHRLVGVAWWPVVATAMGRAVATASLGFDTTRGRKRSGGVQRRWMGNGGRGAL